MNVSPNIFPILAVVLGTAAQAEEFPSQIDGMFGGGDTVRLDQITAAEIHVTYSNAEARTSRNGTAQLQIGGVGVSVSVDILTGTSGAERLTVTPADGFFAFPDVADVNDGDSVTVTVVPAMF